MKTLTVAILMMLTFGGYANEQQQPPTDKKIPRFLKNSIIVDGNKNPEKMPKYVLMRSFMGMLTNPADNQYGMLFRGRMIKETGLELSSIDMIEYYAGLAQAENRRLAGFSSMCNYLKIHGKAATKQGMAQALNGHEESMRRIFGDIYDNLEDLIPASEAAKLRHYLSTIHVKGMQSVRTKDVRVEDVDLKRDLKDCNRRYPE